jgi:6-phosphofructokinase
MKIAVLTAGGVAPGMNAAVRAVAQKAFSLSWEVVGVEDGFGGILEGRISPIDRSRIGGLMHRGGTFLGSGRSKEVRETEGQERAAERLEAARAARWSGCGARRRGFYPSRRSSARSVPSTPTCTNWPRCSPR